MKYAIGQRVKIVQNECGSCHGIGDIGVIVRAEHYTRHHYMRGVYFTAVYLISVNGVCIDGANWSYEEDLQVMSPIINSKTTVI